MAICEAKRNFLIIALVDCMCKGRHISVKVLASVTELFQLFAIITAVCVKITGFLNDDCLNEECSAGKAQNIYLPTYIYLEIFMSANVYCSK